MYDRVSYWIWHCMAWGSLEENGPLHCMDLHGTWTGVYDEVMTAQLQLFIDNKVLVQRLVRGYTQ